MSQITINIPAAFGFYLDRLKEPSTWVSIALVLFALDNQGYLPPAWHRYVLIAAAAMAALGIHLPGAPTKTNGGPKP